MLQLRKSVLTLALAAFLVPISAEAQSREVISKAVSVGGSEATLHLEFADEGTLEITFSDGEVFIDGDRVGSFEPGSELDDAWRELLGEAIALDDGPLSEMLADWTVPAELAGDLADIAREIDDALEEALDGVAIEIQSDEGGVSISIGDESSFIGAILGSVGRLGLLDEALEGLDDAVRVHVGEDVVVPEGSVVEGNLVLIEGTARIEGEVDGDVVVVGGALDLRESGNVRGEVRVADTRVIRNEGTIERGLVDVLEEERDTENEIRMRLRDEIRDELRSDLRNEIRDGLRGDEESFSIMAPLRPVVRGVTGVAEKLFAILILALIGVGVLAFAGDNVEVIAETAKRSPGRSAMVGFAGSLLLIPLWALGFVALVISIIGIPVAVAWLPLFPLAAVAAGLIGYLAVARNAGEWLADSEYPWTGWIRSSNSLMTMVGGLAGLMLAFILAHVLSIAPFLGFFSGLLSFVGVVITLVAIQIGFGAVLLTRAGRRREHWAKYDPDAAWEAAMRVDVEDDMDGEVEDDA